jgi:hypothetical protein
VTRTERWYLVEEIYHGDAYSNMTKMIGPIWQLDPALELVTHLQELHGIAENYSPKDAHNGLSV